MKGSHGVIGVRAMDGWKVFSGALLMLPLLGACTTSSTNLRQGSNQMQPQPPRQLPVETLMAEALVPGLQLATIRNGRIDVESFGVARADTAAPVTEQTVFEAASLSKPVFAYGVLRLASEGRIALDTPIGHYLPDLPAHQAQATARRLLTHTAPVGSGSEQTASRSPGQPSEVRFSYSGEGYNLLQRVVERITGQPIQDYMRAAVFAPLEMESSSFVWRPDYEARKASGHAHAGTWAGRNRISQARVASSLETTAGDYARFLVALSQGAGLTAELKAGLVQPAISLETCVICTDRPPTARSQNRHWALGIGLEEMNGRAFMWHWGDNQTMQSYAAMRTDGSQGIVILTNSANGHSIARQIASSVLSSEAPGYAWVGSYGSHLEPERRLLSKVVRQGVTSVTAEDLALPQPQLLLVAERLIAGGRAEDSVRLLRLASNGKIESAELLALLAEAERVKGDAAAARVEAGRALAMDPTNSRARQVLERLSQSTRVLSATTLSRYAGVYESPFGELTIRARDQGLRAQLLDQPESAMLPLSDNAFLMEAMGVPIEFIAGPDGAVTHAIVKAGNDFRLRRLSGAPDG